jgi:hypothetical protein
VQLLNAHSEIFIGNERYLYLYPQIKERSATDQGYFGSDRFELANFSVIHSGETFWNDISQMDNWEQGAQGTVGGRDKIKTARIVGDKAPLALWYFDDLMNVIHNCKFITVSRGIVSVGRSWQRRADNASDHLWKRSDNFGAAVPIYLKSVRFSMLLKRKGLPIVDVFSPKLCDRDDEQLSKVIDFLGVSREPKFFDAYRSWRSQMADRAEALIPTEGEKRLVFQHLPLVYQLMRAWEEGDRDHRLEDIFWEGFHTDLKEFAQSKH